MSLVHRASLALLLLTSPAWATDPKPRPVRVETATFLPSQLAATWPGTVQARVLAGLAFRVGGKISERLVNTGDRITAGQVLARLDPADLRLTAESNAQAVKAAEAEAVNARADYARFTRLGAASPAWLPSELDKRKAALDGAEARLAQAQRQFALAEDQLAYTELKADADGVVTDIKMEPGQVVTAGQTVASLAHTAETEIVVDVPENRLRDVREATSIAITIWSLSGVTLHGKTREIGGLADSMSRTFAVRISVLDPPRDATLGLGMTAAVRFERPPGPPVAVLPASAVVSLDGAPSVWVFDPASGRAVAHPVQVAAWHGDGKVAITGGIPDGAEIVTAGAAQLDPTMPVTRWSGAIR